jgi:cytochrome c biogenesis protein CcdA
MSLRIAINKLRFYFGFLLLGLYLTVGFIFIFTELWADLLPKWRYLTGILLILFGAFRFYVGYRRYINKSLILGNKEKDNNDAAEE